MFNLILFLIVYFGFLTFLSYKLTSGYDNDKQGYLVANRSAGVIESGMAIAGGWVLGGALFAVVEFSYKGGLYGFVWYIVPQVIGILFFGWFSKFVNQNIPNGYTISDFIRQKFGLTVSSFYQVCLMAGSIGLISLTMTALTKFLTYMQVDNVPLITGIVTVGTLCYALKGGLRTNIVIGGIQMMFMLAFCAVVWSNLPSNSLDLLSTSLTGGISHYTGIFDYKLMSATGISIGIMSLSGLLGNQCFYQKSFAQQNNTKSNNSFFLAAFLWSIVPLTFGAVTFIASASGITTKDIADMHLEWLRGNIGYVSLLAFGLIVLNATSNCLDTQGNSVGSIVANDWIKDESKSVFFSRVSIVTVAIIGWLISILNLPMSVIMLAYGIFRILLFFVTILAVRTDLLNKAGMLTAIVLVAPTALYLNFNDQKMIASILAFTATPVIALIASRITNSKNRY